MPPTVAPGATLVAVHDGDGSYEGPAWHPGTSSLYFTAWGGPTTRIMRLDATGAVTVWAENAGGVNGTFLANDGRLLGARVHSHHLVSYAPGDDATAHAKILAHDASWHQPNDLCQTVNGNIYFTDPDFAKRRTSAVYRLTPAGRVDKVVTDMVLPNGVITSNDGRTLYVSDSARKHWRAYPIGRDGKVGPGRLFFDPPTPDATEPDGMAIDDAGNLYLTGRGGVWVAGHDGRALGLIAVPEFAANVTFGGADGRKLFITCRGRVYRLDMRVRGGAGSGRLATADRRE